MTERVLIETVVGEVDEATVAVAVVQVVNPVMLQ